MTPLSHTRAMLLKVSFLPSDLPALALDIKWRGPESHLAPSRKTPLSKALMGKTNCGLFVLAAACLIWAAQRLKLVADVNPLLCTAEALLCYQSDAAYFNRDGPTHLNGHLPLQREIVETLCYETSAIFQEIPGEHSSDPPIQAVETIIFLTRHILGPEWLEPFKDWVKTTIARLDRVAQNHFQTFQSIFDFETEEEFVTHLRNNVGNPLPLTVCGDGPDRDSKQYRLEFEEFMQGVDWSSNPYLSSPEVIQALGLPSAYGRE